MSSALDSVRDPLITPLLALLKDAVNSDLAAEVPAGLDATDAIATTEHTPFDLRMSGETALPLLSCYRLRSRSRTFSVAHVDHVTTLQLMYVTPAAAREQLDERWPLLDRVWRSALGAMKRGCHPSHLDGAEVLEDAGVVKVDLSTALKREDFVDRGDLSYPSFLAEIDVTWRDGAALDTSTLYPALSFEHRFFVDGTREDGAPDVVSRSLTPAGVEAEDETPYEEEGTL